MRYKYQRGENEINMVKNINLIFSLLKENIHISLPIIIVSIFHTSLLIYIINVF